MKTLKSIVIPIAYIVLVVAVSIKCYYVGNLFISPFVDQTIGIKILIALAGAFILVAACFLFLLLWAGYIAFKQWIN